MEQSNDKSTKIFNLIAGIIVFLMGCALEIKNLFITNIPSNGYELVFGLELIAGGIFLVQGKFKGFNRVEKN